MLCRCSQRCEVVSVECYTDADPGVKLEVLNVIQVLTQV